jgi:hypothetical protein
VRFPAFIEFAAVTIDRPGLALIGQRLLVVGAGVLMMINLYGRGGLARTLLGRVRALVEKCTWAAPPFASSPILARNAHVFHFVWHAKARHVRCGKFPRLLPARGLGDAGLQPD